MPSLWKEVPSSLNKAGFTDVSARADSFVVQAKDKDGQSVTMLLAPDSFTEGHLIEMLDALGYFQRVSKQARIALSDGP
jgi:hypothetical protein